jgi:RimJ/RimL family protein N-acetyltransferase
MARFVRRWEERGFGLWAVEYKASDGFIGCIGLLYQNDWLEGAHKTEVAWQLDHAYWRRGLATEGALASLRYGFEELGQERIISSIHPANLASRRVAEKAGLTLRGGTRWRSVDVVWYAIERPDWKAESR